MATAQLADSFAIECPLGRFRSLRDLWDASASHYRGVTKTYSSWDLFAGATETVVAVAGTLSGESARGAGFEHVRYLDRLVLRKDRIVMHQFWNDLAAAGVLGPVGVPGPRLEGRPSPMPEPGTTDVVREVIRYQSACTLGDVATAAALVAPGADFVFPGRRFSGVDAVVGWLAHRFRWIEKVHERWDAAEGPDGAATVLDLGTVRGETMAGHAFGGVRFVDRVVLREGRIVRQEVWNDLAYRLPA